MHMLVLQMLVLGNLKRLLGSKALQRLKVLLMLLMLLLQHMLLLMVHHRIKATAPLPRGRKCRKQRRPTGNGQTKSGVRLEGQLPPATATSTTTTEQHGRSRPMLHRGAPIKRLHGLLVAVVMVAEDLRGRLLLLLLLHVTLEVPVMRAAGYEVVGLIGPFMRPVAG